MAADSNVAPVIIKKVKKGGGEGHHGGAWKVAYADFVTAMMAFFLLMWLLSSTSDVQRNGIADYFTPTIAITKVSGGGDGALGGDSVTTEETRSQNGRGATALNPAESVAARGLESQIGTSAEEDEAFKKIEEELLGVGGESMVEENAMKHIFTKITDEGLVIELYARPNAPLFEPGTSTPMPLLLDLARLIHSASKVVVNEVAVEGHVPSEPLAVAQSTIWEQSAARADRMRKLLGQAGMNDARIRRVTGHANRELATTDPLSVRNDRLEIIFLRDDRK